MSLDKFYTRPNVVDLCLNLVEKHYDWNQWDLILEPSAGSGNFYHKIPVEHKIGIDIEPDDEDIIKQDFFEYEPPEDKKKILVIGNPPFGRNSSIAFKFFNRSAEFASHIMFIIPKSFRRRYMISKLNKYFHLVYDIDMPNKSFIQHTDVFTCFQIWEKRDYKRIEIKLPLTHKDWDFISKEKAEDSDFAMRCRGSNVGLIVEKDDIKNIKCKPSWYYFKSNIELIKLITNLKKIEYKQFVRNVARIGSLNKTDLVKCYTEIS